MDEERPKPLEYATPEVRERKDSIEYYREPPSLSKWSLSDFVIWIIAFVTLAGLLFWYAS